MANELAERWLKDAAIELQERVFTPINETLPELRYRVGLTPGSRGGAKSKTLGVYVKAEGIADGVPQIYISPTMQDEVSVLKTLTHELCHALRPADGHGKAWRALAQRAGLAGKAVNDSATDTLAATLADIARDLGDYPHGALAERDNKQTTRQRKVVCAAPRQCDIVMRMSKAQWESHHGDLFHAHRGANGAGDWPFRMEECE